MASESTLLADMLFVVLPRDESLSSLHACNKLDRLWLLPSHLAHSYARTVIVRTAGEDGSTANISDIANERRIAESLGASFLCWNTEQDTLGALVQGCDAATVRTIGFAAGTDACNITDALRQRLHHVALIVSGDVLWSRTQADKFGTDSPEAAHAAEIEAALCARASAVIGSSDSMVGDLAWRYKVPVVLTHVVPAALSARLPVVTAGGREQNTIICACSMTEADRVDLVIEAHAILRDMGERETKLTILGSGPALGPSQRFAEERCPGSVTFIPDSTDQQRADLVSRASVFVSATTDEQSVPFVLEAMATGAALVVTNGEGAGHRLQHGVTGLAMPPEPDAIARAIEGLIDDECWRDALGMSAMRDVRSKYAVEHVSEAELNIHRVVLHKADVSTDSRSAA